MQQRVVSGFVRALSRGEVHADEAPLVVESEPSVQSAGGDAEPHRSGAVPGGGSLRRGGFPSRAAADGEDVQGIVQAVQRPFAGNLPENIQLLRRCEEGWCGIFVGGGNLGGSVGVMNSCTIAERGFARS